MPTGWPRMYGYSLVIVWPTAPTPQQKLWTPCTRLEILLLLFKIDNRWASLCESALFQTPWEMADIWWAGGTQSVD